MPDKTTYYSDRELAALENRVEKNADQEEHPSFAGEVRKILRGDREPLSVQEMKAAVGVEADG